jgi:predicted transcriptional regulator with HTH domain
MSVTVQEGEREEVKRIVERLIAEGRAQEAVILIYLLRYPRGALLADIREVVGKGKMASHRQTLVYIMRLKELGLIEEERRRRNRLFWLTEKGVKVAEMLANVLRGLE